jgi:hypothetical protein
MIPPSPTEYSDDNYCPLGDSNNPNVSNRHYSPSSFVGGQMEYYERFGYPEDFKLSELELPTVTGGCAGTPGDVTTTTAPPIPAYQKLVSLFDIHAASRNQ